MLQNFGFDHVFFFCDWISSILHSVRLSILVNGNIVGYFLWNEGCVREIYCLHLFFCLVEEVLSKGVSGSLVPVSYCMGMSLSTHILYMDDILIFVSVQRKISDVCFVFFILIL